MRSPLPYTINVSNAPPITLRSHAAASDADAVRRIVESTGFFSPEEIDIALELINDRLTHGENSHYQFIFADDAARDCVGYACFGRTTGTLRSFDLYWIAVRADLQRAGVGRMLLREAERRIASVGGPGARIYVETSSRAQYQPTREFYQRNGYAIASTLDDFYAPGDGKVTFVKVPE